MIFRNELLWFCMLVINFGLILFAYKKFGRIGLYAWIPISTILANIQVVLLVDLFGFGKYSICRRIFSYRYFS